MNFDYHFIEGFDVSFYQDDNNTPQQIDFVKMQNWGANFVIIKVGQATYADPDFQYNWRESKKAGLPRGGYWFGDKRVSGKSQAQTYWRMVKDDQPEGILAVDYEWGSWTDWNQLYNFLSEFQQLSGYPSKRLPIYTGYPYWTKYSPKKDSQLEWFLQFPLWLAWYTSDPKYVKVPKPWKEVLIWQDGTPAIGEQVGVESKEIDHNRFNGDRNKFMEYFSVDSTPPPPTDKTIHMDVSIHSDGTISGTWRN